ncbi:MAG TPA: type 4a pilus biogenesis protein PilO [Gaiellaceae bacterium]|nr:type 4a pilus biogenesis protein PilO [Gaiellaceae bacterium]
MKRKPSQKALAGVLGALLVLAAVASYFLMISPQRSKAAELQKEADATRAEVTRVRQLAVQVQNTEPIRVADLFRMTKAMPSEVDMPGMILQLNRIARETGIRFDSITPQAAAEANGAETVPINLVFQGNYFELADFLFRVRSLVSVRGGTLDATGRLFVVNSVSFSEGEKKFPQIAATLTVAAYVYGSSASAAAAAAPPATAPPASPPPANPDTPPAASAAPADATP